MAPVAAGSRLLVLQCKKSINELANGFRSNDGKCASGDPFRGCFVECGRHNGSLIYRGTPLKQRGLVIGQLKTGGDPPQEPVMHRFGKRSEARRRFKFARSSRGAKSDEAIAVEMRARTSSECPMRRESTQHLQWIRYPTEPGLSQLRQTHVLLRVHQPVRITFLDNQLPHFGARLLHDLPNEAVSTPKLQGWQHFHDDSSSRISLSDTYRQLHTVEAAVACNFRHDIRSRFIGQGRKPRFSISTEHRGAKTRRCPKTLRDRPGCPSFRSKPRFGLRTPAVLSSS